MLTSSSLMGAELIEDTTDGYVVKLTNKDANIVYPLLDDSMGNYINTMVVEMGTDVNASNAGQRFISRLVDNSGAYGFGETRPAEVASVIESAAQMAQVGAVGRVTMDVALSAGNASVVRNTTTGLGSNGQNMAAVTLDAQGGLSAGTHVEACKTVRAFGSCRCISGMM